MDKTQDLLAMLDMCGGEQQIWWEIKQGEQGHSCKNCLEWSAFRLRDEAVKRPFEYGKDFETVAVAIQNYILYPPPNPQLGKSFEDYLYTVRASSMWVSTSNWWMRLAKPIHWIIAALIAKEMEAENNR